MIRTASLLILLTPAFALAAEDAPARAELKTFSFTNSQRIALLEQRAEYLEASRPSMAWPLTFVVLGTAGGVLGAVTSLLIITALAALPVVLGLIFAIANGARNVSISREAGRLRDEQHRLMELARF